jgi:tRNA(Ile)-lysidine synthase
MKTQPKIHSLVRAVDAFLARERIEGRPILAAVSGGPDSLALLRALHITCPSDTPVFAAHLNHQLRGEESDADQAFVEDFCKTHGLTLYLHSADVREQAAASGANLEATARRVRYGWLAEVAELVGAGWIATGHSADDQAETVLHHLFRGTGLRGLRGTAARRPIGPGIDLVRPLLKVTRAEITDFLQSEQLVAREDSTNQSLRYTRNRIRHELIPYLQGYFNGEIVAVLSRLAEQAEAWFQAEEESARRLLEEAEKPRAGTVVVLDAARLAAASRNQVRELFHFLWEREAWSLGDMTFAHWDRLADLIFNDHQPNHTLDLPARLRAERRDSILLIRNL